MKPLYIIEVHSDALGGLHCSCAKQVGDISGLSSPCGDKADVLGNIRHITTQWLRFDHILGRHVDPPSIDNTELVVDPKGIVSATEVFTEIADTINKSKGVKTLKDFFG